MYSGNENTISKEIYQAISERIAFYIGQTERRTLLIEVLFKKITEDDALKPQLKTPWLILQIKNRMVKDSLLFVSFDKPLHQFIGLTLKGKAVFQIY